MKIYLNRLFALAFALLALAVSLPASAEQVRLAPVSPWRVDWTETSCTLARGFGTKEDPQVLRFEQFGQGQSFQLVITAKALQKIRQTDKPTLIYGTGKGDEGYAQTQERALVGYNTYHVPTLFIASSDLYGDTPGNARTIEASITELHVKARQTTITFETGALDKPFDAMRKCTDDLVRTWGLDPEAMKALARWPIPKSSPDTWLKSDDYPSDALMKGRQAMVTFRLLVDETGMPTDCLVQRSYSGKGFEKTSCQKVMMRARFDPALDVQGKPVPSYIGNTISWIMQ